VSACPSSPITVITDRVAPTLDRVPPIGLADRVVDGSDGITTADDLLVVLTRIRDPRARRAPASAGQRAGCGGVRGPGRRLLLCRDRRVVHELPISVRVRLGLGRCRLSESTIRRILQAIDADLLDQALCEWLVEEADPTGVLATHRSDLVFALGAGEQDARLCARLPTVWDVRRWCGPASPRPARIPAPG
jgi:hypothetical protein